MISFGDLDLIFTRSEWEIDCQICERCLSVTPSQVLKSRFLSNLCGYIIGIGQRAD